MMLVHLIAELGDETLLEAVLDADSDSLEALTLQEESPLMLAVKKSREGAVRVLLGRGANVYARNKQGKVAASLTKNKSIKRMIEEREAEMLREEQEREEEEEEAGESEGENVEEDVVEEEEEVVVEVVVAAPKVKKMRTKRTLCFSLLSKGVQGTAQEASSCRCARTAGTGRFVFRRGFVDA
jgi:predicted transcriptional regulator YheO